MEPTLRRFFATRAPAIHVPVLRRPTTTMPATMTPHDGGTWAAMCSKHRRLGRSACRALHPGWESRL